MIANEVFLIIVGAAIIGGQWLGSRYSDVDHSLPFAIFSTIVALAAARMLTNGPIPVGFSIWTVPLFIGLSSIALIDFKTRTVPDLIVVPLVVLGLAHSAFFDDLLFPAAIGVGVIILFSLANSLIFKSESGFLGGGDVLLLAAAVAWLGPGLLPDVLFLAAVFLIFQGLFVFVKLQFSSNGEWQGVRYLPFGPAIGMSMAIVWIAGPIF